MILGPDDKTLPRWRNLALLRFGNMPTQPFKSNQNFGNTVSKFLPSSTVKFKMLSDEKLQLSKAETVIENLNRN